MSERLKQLRKALKLSQTELGDKLGVSRDVISNIELGRVELKEHFIKLICAEFCVNEQWLKIGAGDMFKPHDRETEIAKLTKQLLDEKDTSFKNRLISVLANLNENQWETLAEIAEKLAKK